MSVLIKHKPVILEGKLVTLKYHLYPKLQFSGCQSNRQSFSSWTWEGLHVLLFIWVSLFSRLESYIVENGLIFPQIEVWFMWDQRSRCLRMGACLLQCELLCCQFFFCFYCFEQFWFSYSSFRFQPLGFGLGFVLFFCCLFVVWFYLFTYHKIESSALCFWYSVFFFNLECFLKKVFPLRLLVLSTLSLGCEWQTLNSRLA